VCINRRMDVYMLTSFSEVNVVKPRCAYVLQLVDIRKYKSVINKRIYFECLLFEYKIQETSIELCRTREECQNHQREEE